MCEQFKLAGPNAIAATKEILSEAARLDRDAALERMVEHIARLRVSAEGQVRRPANRSSLPDSHASCVRDD